ncbi:MAG TPA: glycosyltransferase, partial [Vicinamibacteria bacterium]|nr:glycosyltransferase [Vicinamibacteria bacterium]
AHLEGTLESSYRVPAIDRAIREVVEAFQPDCVHAQHLLNLSTGLFDAARSVDAPVVFTLHDYWLSCPRDGLRMRADGALCSTVDHRVCAECLSDSPYLVSPLQRRAARAAGAAGLGSAVHALHRRLPRLTSAAMRLMRRASPPPRTGLERALDDRVSHLSEIIREADAVLAPTRFARDRAVEWGAPAEKVRVVTLGAITGPTLPRRAGRRTRFGYVGTMAPHKGVHVLLEAVKRLARPGWTLDLVGRPDLDPEYGARLRAIAHGDSRIRFRGPVPPEAHDTLWPSLDVLVVPSLWWENSPLAVLEALAAGVPIVASRTGGVPEILPPRAGVLVPPGDAHALQAALEEVLEGRILAEPLEALPLKTARAGAGELAALYSELTSARRPR